MALSPMMRQYLDIKEQYKDAIVFFRLGDFYEMFFEDAQTASRELELTLTGRDCGLEKRAPMCGVPYHAADTYLSRLVDKGYKVVVCEQMEDPATAKGIVKRAITKIVTPGTIMENGAERVDNNFMLCVCYLRGVYGTAYVDASTGDFFAGEFSEKSSFLNAVSAVHPSEILVSQEDETIEKAVINLHPKAYLSRVPAWYFEEAFDRRVLTEHFKCSDLSVFDSDDMSAGISSAGALITYIRETQKTDPIHITRLSRLRSGSHMVIDSFTYRNLELTATLRDGKRRGSLISILDRTKTAMGARLLRRYIDTPLQDRAEINRRLNAVGELKNNFQLRSAVSSALLGIYDIERLLARISYGTMDARTANALKQSIQKLPEIKNELSQAKTPLLKSIYNDIDPLEDLYAFLDRAVNENPPAGITEGNIIKDGFNDEVDKLRNIRDNGKNLLLDYEKREREATGIKNLKVSYNRVFGYYIEVTRSYLHQVPYTYTRKQTLTGAERFITKELKDIEDSVLNAQDRLNKLEYELFLSIREKLTVYIERLQNNASAIACCDVIYSFAQAAYDNGYVKPTVTENGVIDIKGGRHPVVEKSAGMQFVPNDVYLDNTDSRLLLITGPNMAGKSTYMRQTGLIVLMAHMGSFVPASSASICIVDRVFTRVGASDDLASGQSTFMVEMNELAGILNNATEKSLLILDEIGRGTSTLDGLSIAWATIEYILKKKTVSGSKTLFATHYHELTDLEGTIEGLKNYSVTVKEFEDEIVFLHKIKRGGSDRSFGIEVARLAGLPDELLSRAKILLQTLETNTSIELDKLSFSPAAHEQEMSPEIKKLINAIKSLDINSLTPLEALSVLNDLKERIS